MKALIRKIPRPDPRRIFSGASGSGTLSGSSPGPWSAIRMISESDVVSNEAVMCLLVSYELPCSTAFTAASRTAMAICGIVSSSNPARCATCSAVSSILLTLSRDESRVKLTRLVVESAKDVLVVPVCRLSAPGYQSRITAVMAVCLWIPRKSRLQGDLSPFRCTFWGGDA
jgi:hypothetical protein